MSEPIEPPRVSAWTQATDPAGPVCPRCGAQNRPPRVVYIEVDESGHAFCRSCSAMWIVPR